MALRYGLLLSFAVFASPQVLAQECSPLLSGELPALRSSQQIDLCQAYAGKVLLVVNTASNCGFTTQFSGLEALYQRYREQGFEILGVPSDDFRQEADTSEETAKVCYVNYGVTFAMTEPQEVSGDQAVALFAQLNEQSAAPRWNFYKYLIGRDGQLIERYSSLTKPDDQDLQAAIEAALAQ